MPVRAMVVAVQSLPASVQTDTTNSGGYHTLPTGQENDSQGKANPLFPNHPRLWEQQERAYRLSHRNALMVSDTTTYTRPSDD